MRQSHHVPDRVTPREPDREEDDPEGRWVSRLLRVADEFVRKRNGKKGGERAEPDERPENERREP